MFVIICLKYSHGLGGVRHAAITEGCRARFLTGETAPKVTPLARVFWLAQSGPFRRGPDVVGTIGAPCSLWAVGVDRGPAGAISFAQGRGWGGGARGNLAGQEAKTTA
jgi:hypothetical protein